MYGHLQPEKVALRGEQRQALKEVEGHQLADGRKATALAGHRTVFLLKKYVMVGEAVQLVSRKVLCHLMLSGRENVPLVLVVLMTIPSPASVGQTDEKGAIFSGLSKPRLSTLSIEESVKVGSCFEDKVNLLDFHSCIRSVSEKIAGTLVAAWRSIC